jgi:hypothetical protein
MILPVHDRLRAHLSALIASRYSLDEASMPSLSLEYPPNRELGDLGSPVAFELARRLRSRRGRSPRRSRPRSARFDGRSRQSPPLQTAISMSFSNDRRFFYRVCRLRLPADPTAAGKAIG